MPDTRILSVQDVSCVGECSLAAALPILSAAGFETAILPTAVLSTHTGFPSPVIRDLTADMPGILAHWRREGIRFNAVCTGYLGSAAQVALALEIFDTLRAERFVSFVDPAMADGGRLYAGFDDAFVREMKTLAASADVVLPNITEACLLTGSEYREACDEAYVRMLLERLRAAGAKTVVLTGVSLAPDATGVAVLEGDAPRYYSHRRVAGSRFGTGDIFAAAFAGAYLRGRSAYDAAALAADFVVRCIENTLRDPAHWYGVRFEPELPYYVERLRREARGAGKRPAPE